ncbi:MAG: hypothetical protein Q4D38_01230 [Planctomycetia bacterium]|nr:hypothetical protein [Planctomycetia bacterium]
MSIIRWAAVVALVFILGASYDFSLGNEKGDGFALSHDPEKYGIFLPARKVEGSMPTSDVVLHGDFLFAVGYNNITIYDVSEPTQPKELSRLYGIGEGRQIAVYKDHLYATARTGGMYVVDISNPELPRLVAHYDTMELATGICCVDDVAYISQRQFGTEFVDISNPSDPLHLGFVVSGEAQSVDCLNGILYAGDWGMSELSVMDVRNPKNPCIVGSAKLDGLGDGVYVRDSICYAATGPKRLKDVPAVGHGLDIFCVANPKAPELLGRIKFPPQVIHTVPDFWSVSVDEEKMAYVADTYNGVFCVDVSDPQKPVSVAHSVLPVFEKTGNPDPVGAVEPGVGVLYVAGYQNGVYVVEASDVARPLSSRRKGPKLEEPVRQSVVLSEKVRNDFFVLPTRGQALAAAWWKENLIWVAAGTDGLWLVEVGDNVPIVRKIYPTHGFVYDVCVHENRLYVAEGIKGVGIYRVWGDGERKIGGRWESGQPVRQIALPVPNRFLVTKEGNSRLNFLDISEPTTPRLCFFDQIRGGILYGRDLVSGVSPSGRLVCVAQKNGLLWYDFSGETPERKVVSFPGEVSFADGACWMGDRLLYFRRNSVYLCEEGEARALDEVPRVQIPHLAGFGKATACGNVVCFTNRRLGKILFFDFSNENAPQLLREYSLPGHPELAIWVGNRVVIPCGHAGLLIGKTPCEYPR